MQNRREFLNNLVYSGTGIMLFGCGGLHAAASVLTSGTGKPSARRRVIINGTRIRTVDIHGHFQLPEVLDLLAGHEHKHPDVSRWLGLSRSPLWEMLDLSNVDLRLLAMDRQGIDIQAISNAFWYWTDRDLGNRIVAMVNERIAEFCAEHPERFVGLGTLSMQFPDLAVEQMQTGVQSLGLRGFMIAGSVNGGELSDPAFHPFWARAEELGTLIFIHPNGFTEGEKRFRGNGHLANVIGNPLETTVALSHLIFQGTLDRFPGIRICAAHGGGYLPSYIGRSDHCVRHSPRNCVPQKKMPGEYIRQLYFDSLVYTPRGLQHLVNEAGADRILLGTDFPYDMYNPQAVDHVLNTATLSDIDKAAILGNNALRILGIG